MRVTIVLLYLLFKTGSIVSCNYKNWGCLWPLSTVYNAHLDSFKYMFSKHPFSSVSCWYKSYRYSHIFDKLSLQVQNRPRLPRLRRKKIPRDTNSKMISLRFIGIIGIVIVAVSTISESSTTKRPGKNFQATVYWIASCFPWNSFFPIFLAKKSGLCPQPNCKMNVNCARSNDCCALDGSKFCVPGMPCWSLKDSAELLWFFS